MTNDILNDANKIRAEANNGKKADDNVQKGEGICGRINVRPEDVAKLRRNNTKRASLGDPDILLQTFKEYFSKRKISDLIIEEAPKAEKEKKNAHFFKHMNDGIWKPFLYISPRGNLCMPVKNAQKLGLILDKDYEIMKYSNPYRAVIINLKYYNNFTGLLDKLEMLYE